ncbi:2-dehydro-3-deoxyphosphooctonate aldolase [Quercus suber]|uniref:3-deoxy-8-phosphooctulonate synthase n=1 Tax=Quercus suber TaxID=58331 RepID=A0AAW0JIN0_QUESU
MESSALLFNQLKAADPFFLLAGSNVIESEEHIFRMARHIKAIASKVALRLVFKSSFDKANKTSSKSFWGPGMVEGLKVLAHILEKVKLAYDIPIVTDCEAVGRVADIIQIPAFLCHQVMVNSAEKIRLAGNPNVMVCEKGTMFGYIGWWSVDSGGLRELIPCIARMAVAVGVDGIFMEVHDDPLNAPVDGPTQWPLHHSEELLEELVAIAPFLNLFPF